MQGRINIYNYESLFGGDVGLAEHSTPVPDIRFNPCSSNAATQYLPFTLTQPAFVDSAGNVLWEEGGAVGMSTAGIVGEELEVDGGRNIDQTSDGEKDDGVGMDCTVAVDAAVETEGQDDVGLSK